MGLYNAAASLKNSLAVPQRIKTKVKYISYVEYTQPKRNKIICSYKKLHKDVQFSIIQRSKMWKELNCASPING
jgi:hypothetical protein